MSEEMPGKSTETEWMPDDLARKEKKRRKRAFEIDLIRGIAIIDLLFHHTAYDLRYMFVQHSILGLRTAFLSVLFYLCFRYLLPVFQK